MVTWLMVGWSMLMAQWSDGGRERCRVPGSRFQAPDGTCSRTLYGCVGSAGGGTPDSGDTVAEVDVRV